MSGVEYLSDAFARRTTHTETPLLDEKKLMAMGAAALLPGITAIRELIQEQENEYRNLLNMLFTNGAGPKKRGRPSNASKALLQAVADAPAPEPKHKLKHGESLPEMIGKDYTRNGAARYLGYNTIGAFDVARKQLGEVPFRTVKNPARPAQDRGRVNVLVFSRSALDAMAKHRRRTGRRRSRSRNTVRTPGSNSPKNKRATGTQ